MNVSQELADLALGAVDRVGFGQNRRGTRANIGRRLGPAVPTQVARSPHIVGDAMLPHAKWKSSVYTATF